MSEGCIGIRRDDGAGDAGRGAMGAPGAGTPPHHWDDGPLDVRPVAPGTTVRLRDGTRQKVTHEFLWYLDAVRGTDRRTAAKRLHDVLLAPGGWTKAGVRWRRVSTRAEADVVVRVVPQDETVCGPGSAGCYSWGYEDKPVAEVGVEYIGDPGGWSMLVGMELCGHGTFRMHDGYTREHMPYSGSMGTWAEAKAHNWLPSENEIASAKAWLAGQTPAAQRHDH